MCIFVIQAQHGGTLQPELLAPGTTINVSDIQDVVLHALLDAPAPKWLTLHVRHARAHCCRASCWLAAHAALVRHAAPACACPTLTPARRRAPL